MVEIIAEAGVSPLGKLDAALRLADAARLAGADVVKYQTFNPDRLLRKTDPDRLKIEELALNYQGFVKLAKHCEDIGIEFMSTPGEVDSLKFLVEECGVKRIKIGSDDLTFKPLVTAAYKTKLPVILSTGMSTTKEIRTVVDWAVHEGFPTAEITLLHCVSVYPCPLKKANLRAIETLKQFLYPVGYSDHTFSFTAPFLAVALGASVIEKHFAPYDYKGPDKEVSLSPSTLIDFVESMKRCEEILGSGIKEPCDEELKNLKLFRKGKDGLRGLDG